MKILVDFDSTLCQRKGIPTRTSWRDKPVEGAVDAMNFLLNQGHEVKVFTSNPEPEEVRHWLGKWNFPYMEVTNIKEPAQVIIDDRALRFTNWQDIRKYFG